MSLSPLHHPQQQQQQSQQQWLRRYLSKHAWRYLRHSENAQLLKDTIERGNPLVTEEFGVVVMFDISGYSYITSTLALLGKFSSELLTQTVGSYLGNVIEGVDKYSGDVVKFLGDAILVVFSKLGTQETHQETCQRALDCCSHVMKFYKRQEFDLSSDLALMAGDVVPVSFPRKFELALHVGIVSGTLQHVFLGRSYRMDYSVYGDFFEKLSPILNSAKPGELGIDKDTMTLIGTSCPPRQFTSSYPNYSIISEDHFVDPPASEFLSGLDDTEIPDSYQSFGAFKSFNKRGSQVTNIVSGGSGGGGGLTRATSKRMARQRDDSVPLFIIQADSEESMHKHEEIVAETTVSTEVTASSTDLGVSEIDVDLVSKFINPAIIKKMEKETQGAMSRTRTIKRTPTKGSGTSKGERNRKNSTVAESVLTGEFRKVSVIFVNLLFPFNPQKSQTALMAFLDALKPKNGIFQQFAADDKGQTMLACIGLPPWTHPNNPAVAVEVAAQFHRSISGLGPFCVSVATGEILFTTIGSDSRSEAALLGDAVNIAARLLTLYNPNNSVFCDKNTYLGANGQMVEFLSMGEVKLKGQRENLPVWAVDVTSFTNSRPEQQTHFGSQFGYEQERASIMEKYQNWRESGQKCNIIVEGVSGQGKSFLLRSVTKTFESDNMVTCLANGTEIDQKSSFSALTPIMQLIYQAFLAKTNSKDTDSSDPSMRKLPLLNDIAEVKSSSISLLKSTTFLFDKISKRGSLSIHNRNTSRFNIMPTSETTPPHDFLASFGKPREFAPLLKKVLPNLQIAENKFSSNTKPEAATQLLESLLVHIISEYLQKSPVVLIFDDSQWLDSASWRTLSSLVHMSKTLFSLFFTRPIRDYSLDMLKRIADTPGSISLSLKGFNLDDLKQFLVKHALLHSVVIKYFQLWKFQNERVSSVDDAVITEISQRSAGSPLFVALVLDSIDLKSAASVLGVSEGCLKLKDMGTEFGKTMADSIGKAVEIQFDKLPSEFQLILRVGCIFGQYFNLEDLCQIEVIAWDVAEMKTIIAENDRYSFLMENGESAFAFRHITICNSIYATMSFSRRSQFHSLVGDYFESTTKSENLESMLPSLAYHYSRSKQCSKAIDYISQLGLLQFRRGMYKDATQTFSELSDYQIRNNDAIDTTTATLDSLALWKSIQALSLSKIRSFTESRELCLDALKMLKFPWTSVDSELKKRFPNALIHQMKLWTATLGGRRVMWVPNKQWNSTQQEAIRNSLYALVLCGAWDARVSKLEIGYATVELLNFTLPVAKKEKILWFQMLSLGSYLFFMGLPKLSSIYLKRSLSISRGANEDERCEIEALCNAIASVVMARGDLDLTIKIVDPCIEANTILGNSFQAFVCASAMNAAKIFLGDFNYARDFMIPACEKLSFVDPLYAAGPYFHDMFRTLLRCDWDNSKDLLAKVIETVTPIAANPLIPPLILFVICLFSGLKRSTNSSKYLHRYLQLLVPIDNIMTGFTLISILTPLLLWINLGTFKKDDHGTVAVPNMAGPFGYDPESDVTNENLSKLIQQLEKKYMVYYKDKHMKFAYWTNKCYKAYLLFADGHRDLASQLLHETCTKGFGAKLMEEAPFLKLITYSILGKYGNTVNQKLRYAPKAKSLARSQDAEWFEMWIDEPN